MKRIQRLLTSVQGNAGGVPYEVREMTPDDHAGVAAISYCDFCMPREYGLEDIRRQVKDGLEGLVVETEAGVSGFLLFREVVAERVIRVERIQVSPTLRRRLIGSAMLDLVINWLRDPERGPGWAMSVAVSPGNMPADAFFRWHIFGRQLGDRWSRTETGGDRFNTYVLRHGID